MHSRIYQIENNPVDVEDRICEDTIPEWFTSSIADYVADISDENRDSDIQWLVRSDFGKVCRRTDNEITFSIDIGDFFEERFEQFKKIAKDLTEINLGQFISRHQPGVPYDKQLDHLMFLLKEAYDDNHGFYVWHDNELYTLQSWMRQVKPCGVYYIGGVVDYHF